MPIDAGLLKTKETVEMDLINIPGVVGVGVRNRKVVIYVEEAAPSIMSVIPARVDDVPVMVRVTGKLQALAFMPMGTRRTGKFRPVPGGVSISDPTCTAGTLGMWAKDKSGSACLVTNAHVIAINYATGEFNQPGTAVWQPGRYDGGGPEDKIATFDRYALDPSTENFVDGAVAYPDSPDIMLPEVLDGGTPIGMADAAAKMAVFKSGRTTGLTWTTITDVNASVKVSYPIGKIVFKDQIVFENPGGAVIAGGDSGSILLSGAPPAVVGLCFAGSSTVGIANKASRVVEALGVDLGAAVVPTPPEGFAWSAVASAAIAAIPISIIGSEEIRKYKKRGWAIG